MERLASSESVLIDLDRHAGSRSDCQFVLFLQSPPLPKRFAKREDHQASVK